MKKIFTVILLFSTVRATAQQPAAVPDSAITAADSAARAWFGLLADRNYAASWEQADPYFKQHVSRDQWRINASQLDRQFVRAGMRKLVEARWLRDEAPLPRTEYVVLRWLTVIDDWHQVGERIIMAHESDGAWRPATYDLYPDVDGIPLLAGERGRPPAPPPMVRPQNIAPRKP